MNKTTVTRKARWDSERNRTRAEKSIEASAAVVVRQTLHAAAMSLSHVLGHPENEILKTLAAEFRTATAAGLDFATALDQARRIVAAGIPGRFK